MRGISRARSPVSFIAWSSVSGRSQEISEALGGDSKCFYDFGFVDRRVIPLRYLASAVRTVLYLLWKRPRAVIASNPPIFPGLLAYLYGRLTGARVVLDSHPVSFGFDEERKVVTWTMPLHRFLIPRVAGTIVTVDSLVEMVREQGGQATIVHEAQPTWELPAAPSLGARPSVLFVGIFANDEPVNLVIEAAWLLPEVDFHVTGDLRKCPPALLEKPAPNLHFVGFLDQAGYLDAIARANVVMTLTDRAEDVSRAASEAISARRPLIVSDFPAARRYFPSAVAVPNTVEGVAAGVREALERYDEILGGADAALADQRQRWDGQLAALEALVTGT